MTAYHKYVDAIPLLVYDYAAALAVTADQLVSAVVSTSGPAGLSLSPPILTGDTVGAFATGGTYNPIPPPNADDDYTDVTRCLGTTAHGQVLEVLISIIMRQPGAFSQADTKAVAEARDFTFTFVDAVKTPYNDPLTGTPTVTQVSGTGSALTIGAPEIVAVGALPTSGVRVRLGAGSAGVYIVKCVVDTQRTIRLQSNFQLTVY